MEQENPSDILGPPYSEQYISDQFNDFTFNENSIWGDYGKNADEDVIESDLKLASSSTNQLYTSGNTEICDNKPYNFAPPGFINPIPQLQDFDLGRTEENDPIGYIGGGQEGMDFNQTHPLYSQNLVHNPEIMQISQPIALAESKKRSSSTNTNGKILSK